MGIVNNKEGVVMIDGSKYACKKVCVNMYVLCNDTFIYEKQGKSTRFDSEPSLWYKRDLKMS